MSAVRHRVGLDGLFAHQPITGSGQYTLQLWQALSAVGDDLDPILLQPIAGDHSHENPPSSVLVTPPRWARREKIRKLWWEQYGVASASRQAGVRLLHTPYFSRPRFSPVPTVTTIHDVIPFIFPQYAESVLMRLYLRLAKATAQRSTAIITDSHCSRRDIAHWLGIPQDRVHVIPLAADEPFQPGEDQEVYHRLRVRFRLPGPVIFNVGGLDARKNLAGLVEAFARALPQLDPDVRLVIAGRAHSANPGLYPSLEPVIRSWGVSNQVVLTGPISEEEKLGLYRLADLYVYPSLYEGFGLSPLEAMACGTPVIASNRSSLPEVVADGGLLVDPHPDELATTIIAVLNGDDLRRTLARRALDQAARFSWHKTAEMTCAVYRDVLGQIRDVRPDRR